MRALLTAFFVLLALPAFAATKTPLGNYSGQVQPIKTTDTLQTSQSTTSNASINLPHGTAPSSPNNGDCWTTTAGFYCQINGTTVGPMDFGITTIGSGDVVGNSTAGSAAPADTTLTSLFDRNYGSAYGTLIYRGNSNWTGLLLGVQNSSPTVVPSYTAPGSVSFVRNGAIAAVAAAGSNAVPYPGTTTAGDSALMLIEYNNLGGTNPSIAPPSGWASLSSGCNVGGFYQYLFYKSAKLTGSEGGTSVTYTFPASQQSSAVIVEVSGIDPTTTFSEGLNCTTATSNTVAGHSITTTGANELAVHAVAAWNGGSSQTINSPGGAWVNAFQVTNGAGPNSIIRMDTQTLATAQFLAAPSSGTSAGGNVSYGSFDFALIPQVASSVTTAFVYASSVRTPQGRLTLTTGSPVMTSDMSAVSNVFYDCYVGNLVPYYDGSADQADSVPLCQVSDVMATSGTGVLNNAGVFDVWWFHHSGSPVLCIATNGSGGGWASDTGGSNTARGSGYSQIHNTRGYWTNANALTHCYNGATDYGSISADQATYLGSLYTTAAGQTSMQFNPAAASGGAHPCLCLFNAYNRVENTSTSKDSNADYTYATNTWRASDNSSSNAIQWLDGLQQTPVRAGFNQTVYTVTATAAIARIGVNLDATTGAPTTVMSAGETSGLAGQQVWGVGVVQAFAPQLGLHFVQAMEISSSSSSINFAGCSTSPCGYSLTLTAPM